MPHSFQLLVPGGHSVEEEKVSGTFSAKIAFRFLTPFLV